jgi:hypothetical protein
MLMPRAKVVLAPSLPAELLGSSFIADIGEWLRRTVLKVESRVRLEQMLPYSRVCK